MNRPAMRPAAGLQMVYIGTLCWTPKRPNIFIAKVVPRAKLPDTAAISPCIFLRETLKPQAAAEVFMSVKTCSEASSRHEREATDVSGKFVSGKDISACRSDANRRMLDDTFGMSIHRPPENLRPLQKFRNGLSAICTVDMSERTSRRPKAQHQANRSSLKVQTTLPTKSRPQQAAGQSDMLPSTQ